MHMNQGIGAIRIPERNRRGASPARGEHGFYPLDSQDCDQIGDAAYYVWSSGRDHELWKVTFDRTGVAFHDRVDTGPLGITEEDLIDALRMNRWSEVHGGIGPITSHMARKLMIIDMS